MRNKTQTVVIWDSLDADVKFFVVDRDLSHLNRKYVNSMDNTAAEDKEICKLVYSGDGKLNIELLSEFPKEAVLAGAKVIVIGFLP